ncbi:MAG: phosphoglucosamine mutase [Thermoleophilia bacterium]
MRRYFGTDGVRGVFGEGLDAALAERLGSAFAQWLGGGQVLVGRDTRGSGPVLEDALARGIAAGGGHAVLGGVLPTGAVALLAAGAGAVVSASHNPPEYNGVKFFAQGGRKLVDEEEEAIEAALERPGPGGGAVERVDGLAGRYAETILERFGRPLDGLRVGCDCANGALAGIAPGVLERLGAIVTRVGCDPDGTNINVGCGATDLELLRSVVREQGLDLGLAFDGDGDRLLAVDAAGEEVDGDQIVAILALHLGVDLVAVTSMSNHGLHQLLAERGIRVITTDVGDRYVLEALRREGGVLGGEQSGHVIVLDGHTTGDGLAAGLLLCGALAAQGATLAEAAAVMPRWAQVKRNLHVSRRTPTPAILEEVARVNEERAGEARVLVRPSGTEPVVRVLAEARDAGEAESLCARLIDLVERDLG